MLVSADTAQREGRIKPGRRLPRRSALYALVFFAGIGSMATEMCASRLLAPYYGSSTMIWANIIGLILIALSLGYWLGGKLADRFPSSRALGLVVLAGAVLTAVVPFAARPFLNVTINGIDSVSTGAVLGSFAACVVLFVPSVLLLGMVSPFAIRIGIQEVDKAGSTAGRIFALSTAGSLLGTFVPALVTIPLVGTQRTLLGAAALIAAAAALLLGLRWITVAVVLAGLIAIPPGAVKRQPGLLFEKESRYQFIQVVEHGDLRLLYLNEGFAVHSEWRPDEVLTGGEWDMFLAVPPLMGRPVSRIAILGNAGGTTARAFGVYYPEVDIDGVEIDAEVTAAARKYFGLGDNPRLRVITADARPYLLTRQDKYDLIFIDAYRQPYVPFYLATAEFFALCRERLAPDGIVALNISTVPGDDRLSSAIAGTLATQFPMVMRWPALRFNQLVLGFARPVDLETLKTRAQFAPRDLVPLTELLTSQWTRIPPARRYWTDDRAPVEWITDRMIVGYGLSGKDRSPDFLPTRPRN
ncbi:MAG: fused MFS/spermidine synthase [Thermoleophilia bacterium]|nr:fused MFS/spermidine synthase [Thermoleophilia bacterium]